MDANPVAARLIDVARERGTILSAHLGTIVAKEFPQIRSHPEYPGLRSFIERFCEGKIIVSGEHGGDIVYKFAGENTSSARPAPHVATTPWDAFQRPGVSEHLFVNHNTGELLVSASAGSNTDFVEIPPVTAEEHLAIAAAFLPSLQGPDLEEGRAALATSNYWAAWSKLVNKTAYRSPWTALRFDKIRELFRSRLVKLGLADAAVAASLRQLLAEKTEKHRASFTTAPRAQVWRARSNREARATEMRQLVHAVIDTMSDGELRELRLPIGEVLDALETFARK